MSNPAFSFDHIHIMSENPRASAEWYRDMLGATIAKDTVARGAPQIFVELGGMNLLIRGRRPGEAPVPARPIQPYSDFSSHNAWGTDHFGFMYKGDLTAFCAELLGKLMPSASIADAIVFAVYMPPHEPAPGIATSSICLT